MVTDSDEEKTLGDIRDKHRSPKKQPSDNRTTRIKDDDALKKHQTFDDSDSKRFFDSTRDALSISSKRGRPMQVAKNIFDFIKLQLYLNVFKAEGHLDVVVYKGQSQIPSLQRSPRKRSISKGFITYFFIVRSFFSSLLFKLLCQGFKFVRGFFHI